MRKAVRLWWLGFLVAVLCAARSAPAVTLSVTSALDDGSGGTLRAQLAAAVTGDTIVFDATLAGATITLTSALPPIAKSIAIDGSAAPGITISGDGLYQVFFVTTNGVDPTAVSISHVTLANGKAAGQNGGSSPGAGGGGGAAGLGGGLFVDAGAAVSLNAVSLVNNVAAGGGGGSYSFTPSDAGGGGGGGVGTAGANGGLGGGNGGGGGALGGTGGTGSPAFSCTAAGAGSADGAGGGGATCTIAGGAGSFGGGGGGGGQSGNFGAGGAGGFGGGGGGGSSANAGAFGGDGGYVPGQCDPCGPDGGVCCSVSTPGGGGGGAGLGGAIFVRAGGTLTMASCSFQGNASAKGLGGGSNAGDGKGKGGAVFVMTGATASQCNTTYNGNTASDQGGVPGYTDGDNDDVWGTIANGCPPPCPKSQGYWKNTPGAWPAGSLTLGSQSYTKTQLIRLMKMSNTKDASLILADQLIAAKLNVLNGADEPQAVADAIAAADALLALYPGLLPYRVRPQSVAGQQMVALGATLDAYNNGALTGECTP